VCSLWFRLPPLVYSLPLLTPPDVASASSPPLAFPRRPPSMSFLHKKLVSNVDTLWKQYPYSCHVLFGARFQGSVNPPYPEAYSRLKSQGRPVSFSVTISPSCVSRFRFASVGREFSFFPCSRLVGPSLSFFPGHSQFRYDLIVSSQGSPAQVARFWDIFANLDPRLPVPFRAERRDERRRLRRGRSTTGGTSHFTKMIR